MSDIYLHISSGSGPRECQWVTAQLVTAFTKEAKQAGLRADILSEFDGKALPSCLLRVSGAGAENFSHARIGTIRWTGQSPFRKHHKRKNWYVGVSLAPSVSDVPELRESDIAFQTLKATGPGGQHVNATESAVRAVHAPTGVSVTAREERSQHANKRLCLRKLALLFQEQKQTSKKAAEKAAWTQHKQLERGNEIRVYTGQKFKLK